jgi:hypothetical protein
MAKRDVPKKKSTHMEEYTVELEYMDTYVTIASLAESPGKAVDQAIELIDKPEALLVCAYIKDLDERS